MRFQNIGLVFFAATTLALSACSSKDNDGKINKPSTNLKELSIVAYGNQGTPKPAPLAPSNSQLPATKEVNSTNPEPAVLSKTDSDVSTFETAPMKLSEPSKESRPKGVSPPTNSQYQVQGATILQETVPPQQATLTSGSQSNSPQNSETAPTLSQQENEDAQSSANNDTTQKTEKTEKADSGEEVPSPVAQDVSKLFPELKEISESLRYKIQSASFDKKGTPGFYFWTIDKKGSLVDFGSSGWQVTKNGELKITLETGKSATIVTYIRIPGTQVITKKYMQKNKAAIKKLVKKCGQNGKYPNINWPKFTIVGKNIDLKSDFFGVGKCKIEKGYWIKSNSTSDVNKLIPTGDYRVVITVENKDTGQQSFVLKNIGISGQPINLADSDGNGKSDFAERFNVVTDNISSSERNSDAKQKETENSLPIAQAASLTQPKKENADTEALTDQFELLKKEENSFDQITKPYFTVKFSKQQDIRNAASVRESGHYFGRYWQVQTSIDGSNFEQAKAEDLAIVVQENNSLFFAIYNKYLTTIKLVRTESEKGNQEVFYFSVNLEKEAKRFTEKDLIHESELIEHRHGYIKGTNQQGYQSYVEFEKKIKKTKLSDDNLEVKFLIPGDTLWKLKSGSEFKLGTEFANAINKGTGHASDKIPSQALRMRAIYFNSDSGGAVQVTDVPEKEGLETIRDSGTFTFKNQSKQPDALKIAFKQSDLHPKANNLEVIVFRSGLVENDQDKIKHLQALKWFGEKKLKAKWCRQLKKRIEKEKEKTDSALTELKQLQDILTEVSEGSEAKDSKAICRSDSKRKPNEPVVQAELSDGWDDR